MKTRTAAAAAALAVFAAAFAWSAETKNPVAGAAIPAGYRAITVPITGDQMAFLKKGDHVDVLVTFDAHMADIKEKVCATILQYVLVSNVQKPAKLEDKGAVELIVYPNESQFTALALHEGDLHLAIRPEGDKELKPMEMASFRKLFR